jgi:hypothetical protein
MARREIEFTVPSSSSDVPESRRNRDGGKTFIVTEMPPIQAERWANRAILAVGNSGAKIDHVKGAGIAGIAVLGFKALFGINEHSAIELADELMTCIKIKVAAMPMGRPLTEDDIEEVTTRWLLKEKVFELHTGFSWAEIKSALISAAQAASSNTLPTSPPRSARSSRQAKRHTRS